jgi:hypothetical protein
MFSRLGDALIGIVAIWYGLSIAPDGLWTDPSNTTTITSVAIMFWGMTYLIGVVRVLTYQRFGGGRISDSDLVTLRQIAATGWIVMLEEDGGYMAYGPTGEREWLDHWADVEERFGENQLRTAKKPMRMDWLLLIGALSFLAIAVILTFLSETLWMP